MNKENNLGPGAVFEMDGENTLLAQYFVGKSYLNMLSLERVVIGNVTFEPGCRNNWHIHHKGGQILLITAGTASGGCGQYSTGSQTLAWGGTG